MTDWCVFSVVAGDSFECLEDSHCAHHSCRGNGKPTCENNGCVCVGQFKEYIDADKSIKIE